MRTYITLLIAVAAYTHTFAQKQRIEVGEFTELSLGIPAKVYLKQGSSTSVEFEGDEDVLEKIKFDLNGDRLAIRKEDSFRWNDNWSRGNISIYISMKEIERISVGGSGSIESEGQIKSDDITISVSGSGDIYLDIAGREAEMRISGSGSIKLEGNADNAEVRISGSGRMKGESFSVKSFKASISGSGSCYITAEEEIIAEISGSGSIYYSGNPDRVIANSSGSGKVRKM